MGTKSFCEIYIHLVWRTKFNLRILGGELELFVHERLRQIGAELKLRPLAVDSAWDHVHSYYRWHPSVAVSDAVRALKSKTAVEWNKSIRDGERKGELLQWQADTAQSAHEIATSKQCRTISIRKRRAPPAQ